MSDARDAVAEARARTMQLAASKHARKQELQEELDKRKNERAELQAMDQSDEVLALTRDLNARIQAISTELAAAEVDLQAALAEIGNLQKLGGQARVAAARALVQSVVDPDPILRSPEEQALDNARSHIADLDAQIRVGEETEPDPAPLVSPADADEQAIAEFQARRGDKPKKTM